MIKFLPLLLLVGFLSCKKEVAPIPTTELLSKSWKMTNRTVLTPLAGTPFEGMPTNWFGGNPCISDKIQTFQPDGTFLHEKANTCTNDVQYKGTWMLTANNKNIDIKYTGGGYEDFNYILIELTSSKLKVQKIESVGAYHLLIMYEFVPKN